MKTQFSLDLRLARRKAGFTQRDCAHLLGVNKSRMSDLECGKRPPTVLQICTLSLMFGRSFESLYSVTLNEARQTLRGRLRTLPPLKRSYVATFNRNTNLARLKERLDESYDSHDIS